VRSRRDPAQNKTARLAPGGLGWIDACPSPTPLSWKTAATDWRCVTARSHARDKTLDAVMHVKVARAGQISRRPSVKGQTRAGFGATAARRRDRARARRAVRLLRDAGSEAGIPRGAAAPETSPPAARPPVPRSWAPASRSAAARAPRP